MMEVKWLVFNMCCDFVIVSALQLQRLHAKVHKKAASSISARLRFIKVATYRDRRDEKILAFENSPWSQRGRLDLI